MVRFNAETIGELDASAQAKMMRDWFLDNYEDPVHSLPYESREGGYIWVYGGPYDAGQVLRDTFEGLVSDRIIERIARDLFDECPEWAEKIHLIDDDYIGTVYVLEPTTYFAEYQQAMSSVHDLLYMTVPKNAEGRFYGMVFVNLIAIMEGIPVGRIYGYRTRIRSVHAQICVNNATFSGSKNCIGRYLRFLGLNT